MSTLKPQNTRALARGAIIAALYTALTVLLAPLSYGEVQIRFSEAFTLLPILMPEAVPALLVGCLLSNILGGCSIFDIVFGSLATLLAAVCTRRLRDKFWLAALMPVLFNGVIVGAVVHFCYSPAIALPLCMLSVAAGEAVACLVVGPLLIGVLRRVPRLVAGNSYRRYRSAVINLIRQPYYIRPRVIMVSKVAGDAFYMHVVYSVISEHLHRRLRAGKSARAQAF